MESRISLRDSFDVRQERRLRRELFVRFLGFTLSGAVLALSNNSFGSNQSRHERPAITSTPHAK
ncbi:MAG: hypothetical protein V4449_02725 [Patescibacteria group bacterium]